MKPLLQCIALLSAAACSMASAAGPGAVQPGAQPSTTAAASPAKAHEVEKNERLNRCKPMTGDEKRACEKEARAVAKGARQPSPHADAGAGSAPPR